jgi:cytochrome c oxidase cbb3-type subunit 3/ubiquinol-cytochrome c reductase cytochrome c subunit
MIIAGRPELGAPDWRGNTKGKPMSEQEISDVVAWLASHRVQSPGRPYPPADNTQLQELKHGH